ncbi:MAG: DUF5320 domain-containing protein [Kiritimatiellae bacterium]|nr:DUF5320 domain-containing protein [Kiritimatiellia bacterium]
MAREHTPESCGPALAERETCNPYVAPGWTRRGFELRYGWSGGWSTRGVPYAAPHEPNYVPAAPFSEDIARLRQLDWLRRRAARLEAELNRIRQRIGELDAGAVL